jgi:hypothetical protein
MMRWLSLAAAALLAAGTPAWSQPVYKCTSANGAISYQETPCALTGEQKRLADGFRASTEGGARKALEEGALHGDPLSRDFVDELRERERLEHEERLRKEREKPPVPVVESPDWMPPWGWPGPPGLARPKPAPAK